MAASDSAQPRRVKVKGAVLRELRKQRGLSRQEVVDRLDGMGASLNEQKLKRIEDTRRDSYPVASKVAGDLATLLGTKLAVLTGKEPLPDESASRDFLPEFSLALPRAFHNALAVVCFAYDVSPATVIANAPLLFAISAQRSLDARSRSLEELRQAVDALESRRSHLGALHVRSLNADDEGTWANEAFVAEASSIAARDIFGEGVKDLRSRDDEEGYDPSPFVDFLRDDARQAGLQTDDCFYPAATLLPVPSEDGQDLMASAIEAIAGGDTDLKEAITQADCIIPAGAWKALRGASPEQRVAALRRWMERDEYGAKQRESRRKLSEHIAALLGPTPDGAA